MERRGIRTTQATISRDLHDLGLIKVREKDGGFRDERLGRAPEKSVWDRLRVMFANFVIDLKSTGNLLLIRTTPGNAGGVARLVTEPSSGRRSSGRSPGTTRSWSSSTPGREVDRRDFRALLAGPSKS